MKIKEKIQHSIFVCLVMAAMILLLKIDGWVNQGSQNERMFNLLCPVFAYSSPRVETAKPLLSKLSQEFLFGIWDYMEQYPVYVVQSQDPITKEWVLMQEARDEEDKTAVKEQSLEELLLKENTAKGEAEQGSLLTKPVWQSDEERTSYYEGLKNFDTLLQEFYLVDEHTSITAEQLDAKEMLSMDLSLEKEGTGPQILIYHTHSQEGFIDSIPGDSATTVVGAGEKLARILEEEYGFSVLHHKGEYDVESRDYAYANAEPALEQILEENPSIQVVIDLHRDGVAEDTHLVTEQNGVKMAQFMFFNGLSRTNATGDISYLKNPYMQENLAFSFQLQLKCREYYPGLARKIYLKGYRYNMHLRGKSLLIELGAQTNTVEEVMNAIGPIARILAMVLDPEGVSEAENQRG